MKKSAFSLFLMAALAAAGTDFYLKTDATDWSVATSYCTDADRTTTASIAPGSGDTIFVPRGTFSLVSGTQSFNTFANVKRIAPETTDSVIELDVADGDAENPHVVNAMIYHALANDADRGVGTVVKKGAGFLHLVAKNGAVNASNNHVEYGVNFDVRAGVLRFPVDEANNTRCGFLKVASGAAVWFAQSANNGTQMHFDYIEAEAGSLLTNATTRSSHVFGVSPCDGTYSRLSYIKGAIGGGARIWSSGSILLDTEENTARGAVTTDGNLGAFYSTTGKQRGVMLVKKFGNPNEASSLGSSSESILSFGNSGGGFRYIGNGEITSRIFYFYSAPFYGKDGNAYPSFLDAGETGGVTFTGTFMPGSDSGTPPGVRRLFLMGDNANECVLAGAFSRLIRDDFTYPVYITKTGTGTWRFAHNDSRYHVGVTAVRDGTLKFDTITEKGGICSLGLSTVLTPDDTRAVTNNQYVGYAFVLGDEDGKGHPVFEYSGSKTASCSTRPIALAGAGGAVRSSAGALDFAGVFARDAGTSPTLILDGTGTDSVMRDISNGVAGASVNVAKEGTGTWTLGGDLTLSGKVEARAGTLRVDVPHPIAWPERPYTWYRLSIAQIGTNGNTGTSLQMRQICLFDKDGVRQNDGLTMPTNMVAGNNVITAQSLQPGQVWFDPCIVGYTVNTSYADCLSECFREADGYNGTYGRFAVTLKKGSSIIRPNPADGTTWLPIVMRLQEGANSIAYFDIQGFSDKIDAYPTRFKLEGSADGRSWNPVWSNIEGPDQAPSISGYNSWVSDGTGASNSSHARKPGKGFTASTQLGKVHDYFTWYRLSIARIGNAATPNHQLSIRQIGLYNSAGSRINEGLTLAETPGGANVTRVVQGTVPAVGQVGYGAAAAGFKVKNRSSIGHEIQDCFDGVYNGSNGGLCDIDWLTAAGASLAPIPSDPATWIPIVMHLPDGAEALSHFDIQNYGTNDSKMVSRVMLEGSTNGVNWYVIYDNATQGEPFTPTFTTYNQWISDGVSASNDSHARPLGKGMTVSAAYPTDPEPKDQFAHVASVSVAAGATLQATAPLTLTGLTVNTEGAGTLDGFAFAASGTLDISGDGSLAPLPGTYVNCTGIENLSGWSLTRDGAAVRRGRIVVRTGALYVLMPGIVLNFR